MIRSGALQSPCIETLRRLDIYLDKQLDIAESAALLRHLESCASCSQELEARRVFRSRLKLAGRNSVPAPYLGTRVLVSLHRETGLSPKLLSSRWLSIVAREPDGPTSMCR